MSELAPIIDDVFLKKRPLSSSSLKHFRKSPKHYIEYLKGDYKPSPAMLLGSLVDMITLTPHLFRSRYLVVPTINKRTKAGKEEWDSIIQRAGKRMVIFEEQFELAKAIRKALWEDPVGNQLLSNMVKAQIKLQWKDTDTKLPMIGYVDFETTLNGEEFIIDLKTDSNADPIDFMRKAFNYGYHIQGACYLDGYHKQKYRFPEYGWLVVETSPPFGVSFNRFQAKDIEWSKEELYNTLKAFKYCMDNDQFGRSYEFRLFDTLPYHSESLPNYKRNMFG